MYSNTRLSGLIVIGKRCRSSAQRTYPTVSGHSLRSPQTLGLSRNRRTQGSMLAFLSGYTNGYEVKEYHDAKLVGVRVPLAEEAAVRTRKAGSSNRGPIAPGTPLLPSQPSKPNASSSQVRASKNSSSEGRT
jgi:hypothetical protein